MGNEGCESNKKASFRVESLCSMRGDQERGVRGHNELIDEKTRGVHSKRKKKLKKGREKPGQTRLARGTTK